ncbi:MAG: EF-P lysine aminoacylase EpmA [Porticoccaceae bacterium]|nr:EF-P lysine aminoacylase EpmA [Porticoccaceae bacterium]
MVSDGDWRAAIGLPTLQYRARVMGEIRNFLSSHGVLEVDVPVLGRHAVTDPHIDSIATLGQSTAGFLQSSPEFYMKRLLASGSGDIYSLGKAFRAGESGARHNVEFTLLEWYRVGWDEHQLMAEVAGLVAHLWPEVGSLTLSYREAFEQYLNMDPHSATLSELQQVAAERGAERWREESRANVLDLLFSLCVEPLLPRGLVFLYDYPACQAALAQLYKNREGQQVSRRFEVYLNNLELANGYFELTDVVEQRRRFAADLSVRAAADKPLVEQDQRFLQALECGLPSCAGVALGVDRLIMQLLEISAIDLSMPFSWTRR